MEKIFAPGIYLMSHLKLPQKFAIISLLFIIIIAAILYTLFSEINSDINFSKKELMGIEYINTLRNLVEDVQLKRGIEQYILSGELTLKNRLEKQRKKISEDIKAVNKINSKYGDELGVDTKWKKLRKELINLDKNKNLLNPEKNLKIHTSIINNILSLITYIGDSSYLILDPQIDFYYLADIIVNQIPNFVEKIGLIRVLGTNLAINKQTLTTNEKITFTVYLTELKTLSSKLNSDINKVFEYNADIKSALYKDFENNLKSTNVLISTINNDIINAKTIKISPDKYFNISTNAMNNALIIFERGSQKFQYQLKNRINDLTKRKRLIIISTFLLLALIIYLFISFYLYFINTLSNLIKASDRIAKGDLSARIHDNTNDELNQLISSLNLMATNLDDLAKRENLTRQLLLSSITTMDTKEIINKIVTQTGIFFKADKCFYAPFDYETREPLPIEKYEVYLASPDIKDVTGKTLRTTDIEKISRILFEKKQVLVIDETRNNEIDQRIKDIIGRQGIKTDVMVPIMYGYRRLGVLILNYVKEYKKISEDEVKLLSSIANQSAIILYQAQLYNQIMETGNREKLLRSIINELLQSESLNSAIENISSEIGKLFNADRTTFRYYDSAQKAFTNIISEYRKNDQILSISEKNEELHILDSFFIDQIFKTKEYMIINNIEDEKYPNEFKKIFIDFKVKSAVIAPVFYREEPIGILIISNTETFKTWKKENIDLLTPIIQQFAIGIHLFSLNEKLKKSLTNERIINEIIGEVSKYEDHDTIYNLLLTRINSIFNVNRSLHFHFDENNNMFIENEVLSNTEYQSILHQTIPPTEHTEEFWKKNDSENIISNVNTEIKNPDLRNRLLSLGIQSYMLYLSPALLQEYKEVGITMTCSEVPKKWLLDEIDFFKLIIDSASLVYLESKRRQEIENIRKTFIATMTHDLRSPILAEQKALEFMLSRKPEEQLENYFEYLEDIYQTNEELLRIVGNILAIYHYESGRFELDIKPESIEDIIQESIKTMVRFAKYEGSEITTDIEQNLPLVKADKNEIGRVIKNLVSNAIKHNQKGTNIRIQAKKLDNEIQVSVSDNGKGIPESEKANIFQRYPTSKRRIGTGLGLYLSKQIVESHNSRMWFESEAGKGTTFLFTLNPA